MHYSRKANISKRSYHFICYEFIVNSNGKINGSGSGSYSLFNGFNSPVLIELVKGEVEKDLKKNGYSFKKSDINIKILSILNIKKSEFNAR